MCRSILITTASKQGVIFATNTLFVVPAYFPVYFSGTEPVHGLGKISTPHSSIAPSPSATAPGSPL